MLLFIYFAKAISKLFISVSYEICESPKTYC